MKKYKGEARTKKQATLRAKELSDYLKKELGGNWKPRVWENLGWYYSVQLGTMNVNWHLNKYGCLIDNEIGGVCGMGYWDTGNVLFTNPKDAVKFAMKRANDFVKKVTDVCKLNTELISKKVKTK